MDPVALVSTTRSKDRIVGDLRSVRVTIPISTTLLAGECFYVAPYLGVAMEDVTNDGATTQEIALAVGELLVATTKLTSGQTFAKGTKVYWDASTQKFTETPTAIPAGYVYKAKGTETTPVAYIALFDFSSVGASGAVAPANHVAAVADTGETTVADVAGGDVPALIIDINKTGGIVDVLNAAVAKIDGTGGINDTLNAILVILENAGLVKTS